MKPVSKVLDHFTDSRRMVLAAVVVVIGVAASAVAQVSPKLPPPVSPVHPSTVYPSRSIEPASPSATTAVSKPAAKPLMATTARAPQPRRRAAHLKVCGNPQVACKTAIKFQPHDLPFQMPANAVIYDTDLFYAIILQSVKAPADECEIFVPERDRLAAQALFPDRKVFSSRCYEPGEVGYTNTSATSHFMAVYGGMTLAEANRMLARVKATGNYPGANIRRMRAMLNGT